MARRKGKMVYGNPQGTPAVTIPAGRPMSEVYDTIDKYVAKASNGYHHSKGFTLQDFHEPIMIKPKNAQILQDSCLRCHGDFVHELVSGARSPTRDSVQCVHCHHDVGHGARY